MKFGWVDLRGLTEAKIPALVDAAVHARLDGIVDEHMERLVDLPPTVKKVFFAGAGDDCNGAAAACDIVVHPVSEVDNLAEVRRKAADSPTAAAFVEVVDDASLRLACSATRELPYTMLSFRDPTKIPLEIVIAAADKSPGMVVCRASDLEEARIILDVLEKGADGVLIAPRNADDVFGLAALLRSSTPPLELATITVESIQHDGLGDRVCVDTCTNFEKDEGLLVGSYAHGFILCCSETHPLPYMPTRPFRVNAGALHSYVLGPENRTNYLSELQAGSVVLGVAADGRTRPMVVGRNKLESRPLLTIRGRSAEGVAVCLAVQDDWHVRVLGPGGSVHNVTELKQGDVLLGYVAVDRRHVGWPVAEFCIEK